MAGMDNALDFLDLPLELEVVLERRRISVRELLELSAGAVLATRTDAGADAELDVGGVCVGCVEVAEADHRLMIQITSLKPGGQEKWGA